MEILLKIREMAKAVRDQRKGEDIDFGYMTAPCGLPCFECFLYLAQFDQVMAQAIATVLNLSPDEIQCKGCRAEDGKCAHLPMECRVYKCIEKTDMQTCAECSDFPCEYLHPYRDPAEKWLLSVRGSHSAQKPDELGCRQCHCTEKSIRTELK